MDKVDLILTPTPLHRAPRLSEDLGIDLWFKRDDLTGFALGGNKGRKLEYLVAAALGSGSDTVLTCGSAQSNFVRQLAAACAIVHLRLVVVAMALPFEFERPTAPGMLPDGGNVLLDRILGADVRVVPDAPWDELFEEVARTRAALEAEGRRVFEIPVGGSHPLGAHAFVEAAAEVAEQGPDFDAIVFASSSGSTQVGLQLAHHRSRTKVIGVACDPEPGLVEDFARLAAGLDALAGTTVGLKAEDFHLDGRFVGPGYGVPSPAGDAALVQVARREGIFLDPIYSAKAFSGLIEMAREGSVTGRVLFWHTGGVPALFARSQEISPI